MTPACCCGCHLAQLEVAPTLRVTIHTHTGAAQSQPCSATTRRSVTADFVRGGIATAGLLPHRATAYQNHFHSAMTACPEVSQHSAVERQGRVSQHDANFPNRLWWKSQAWCVLKGKAQACAHRCGTNQGNKHLLPHNNASAVCKPTLKAIGAAQCSRSTTDRLTDTP